jgi:hypothetical protein
MRGLMKTILAALTVFAMFATVNPIYADYLPGQTSKAEEVGHLQMVIDYLSIEQFTPSRLEFRKLSPDPVADLIQVSDKTAYPVALRARAVQSLALYKNDERAVEMIDGLMTRVRPGQKLFGPTLVAYAGVHGEAVTEAVAPYAEHPRKDVRMAAVVALGRFCGQSGYDMLKNLVQDENDEVVLARIKQYVD